MDAGRPRRVILVSDAYHLLRARWIFEREGLTVSTSPATDPPAAWHLTQTLREVGGLYWLGLNALRDLLPAAA